MTRNICVTGVSGFIGRYVAAEALRRGYRVTGIDRRQSCTDGIRFIKVDIRDRERLIAVMREHDYVIHLAAVTSNVEFIRNPLESYDINAYGFWNVISIAAKSGCQRFLYASSAAVYVDNFCEDAVIDLQRLRNHYAKSKIMNEMMATSAEDIHQMRTTGLRYFNVYGSGENAKGDYASIVTLLLKAKKNGDALVLYGDGKQARDLINVTDAAQITLNLLEKSSERVYNVGTGVATPYVAIAEMIDRQRIAYVPNPLPSYQYYTRAETKRLRAAVGDYKFIELEKGMRDVQV